MNWAMPYAPELGLRAVMDHPDSRIATAFKAPHWLPHPYAGKMPRAYRAAAAGEPASAPPTAPALMDRIRDRSSSLREVMPCRRPPMMCLPASIAQSGGEWMPMAFSSFPGSDLNQDHTASKADFMPFHIFVSAMWPKLYRSVPRPSMALIARPGRVLNHLITSSMPRCTRPTVLFQSVSHDDAHQ